MTHEERLELARQFNKERAANVKAGRITTAQLIREDKLSAEEIQEFVTLYLEWTSGVSVKVGEIYQRNGTLYEVIQPHTTQVDWPPELVPALFRAIVPAGVIPEWKQPTGAHDAYSIGGKVVYNGKVWTSKINANTTVPDGDEPYNRYWEPEP